MDGVTYTARKIQKRSKLVAEKCEYFMFSCMDRIIPFKPNFERYGEEYLRTSVGNYAPEDVPRTIYVFWTGDNPLTPNRVKGLADLRGMNRSIPVELVNASNLNDALVQDEPLHPAYQYLSLIHRSDYLRCYFMNFKGGGYSDVKSPTHSWLPMFERLERSPEYFGVGYPEEKRADVAQVGGSLEKALKRNFRRLAGNGAFIFRPHTPLVSTWFDELSRRLDAYLPDLKRYPGDTWGKREGYPIPWSGLAGDIFHPLVLKYSNRMLLDARMRPILVDYR